MTKTVRTKFRSAEAMAFMFFQKKFPEKIRNGKVWDKLYFEEWIDRFRSGHPETNCDSSSLKIVQKFRKDGYVWGR